MQPPPRLTPPAGRRRSRSSARGSPSGPSQVECLGPEGVRPACSSPRSLPILLRPCWPQEEQKAGSTELSLEMELPAFAHAVLWQQAAPAAAPEHARAAPPPVGAAAAPAGERGGGLALAQISDPEARAARPPCLPPPGWQPSAGWRHVRGIQCPAGAAPPWSATLPRAAATRAGTHV